MAIVPATRAAGRFEVLVIGASTGGPVALAELVAGLPAPLPVPVLVVQHMPSTFTRLLAERLSGAGRIPFREATTGQPLAPGEGYVAPGGRHLALVRRGEEVHLDLTDDPPENSCRPSVDVLFRTAARVYGRSTLAVILTGMGSDGLLGAEEVRRAGGAVLAQDQATSVVWGMPGAVVQAQLAQAVLPLSDLAPEVTLLLGQGRTWTPQVAAPPAPAEAHRPPRPNSPPPLLQRRGLGRPVAR